MVCPERCRFRLTAIEVKVPQGRVAYLLRKISTMPSVGTRMPRRSGASTSSSAIPHPPWPDGERRRRALRPGPEGPLQPDGNRHRQDRRRRRRRLRGELRQRQPALLRHRRPPGQPATGGERCRAPYPARAGAVDGPTRKAKQRAMILKDRAEIERFIKGPSAAFRSTLIYGRDPGIVRERAGTSPGRSLNVLAIPSMWPC